MKVVLLHGLGQTARDWQAVIELTLLPDVDCPELFSLAKGDITYPNILAGFEKSYEDTTEPFVLCGLSFGAILALDYGRGAMRSINLRRRPSLSSFESLCSKLKKQRNRKTAIIVKPVNSGLHIFFTKKLALTSC